MKLVLIRSITLFFQVITANPSEIPSGPLQITPMPSVINEQLSLTPSGQTISSSTVMTITTIFSSRAPIQSTEQPTSRATNAPITSQPSHQPSEQTIPTAEPKTEQPDSQIAVQNQKPISDISSEIEVNAQISSAPTSSGGYISLSLPMSLPLVVFFL